MARILLVGLTALLVTGCWMGRHDGYTSGQKIGTYYSLEECRRAGAERCVHPPGERSVILPDGGFFPMTPVQDMPPRR